MVEAGEETTVLSQQLSSLVLNMQDEFLKERKKGSIPGSVEATENCLFKQQDLKNYAAVAKVNIVCRRWQGMSWEIQPHPRPPPCGQVAKKLNGNTKVLPQGLAESPMDTSSSMALLLGGMAPHLIT